ncbi:imidazole glycerol phosphate synthase subunit HisH [Cesiribacter andamanensis]|uniref:Imidazole glycerol phosphate synthase subunit HisH n=1 Tax=Cesiribacter andamanensis AMV16 TaxID=1279009 RepID=M7N836_9BACT|nr:imidazole glycerol phosphate synthase subunit HisH [Cesiribacter andamanensis]EMR03371.1 Imidazole glycerol phosphate synthase subunit HisH [Cesiribacter andamanensis AMV16]
MNVALVKYNAGNIRSVTYALQRLGIEPCISDDPDTLRAADKVIFPGVGEASTAMRYLKERQLDRLLPTLRQPVLGVCLGLQLMCRHSEEGDTPCLGIFDVEVRKFSQGLKVPHMGWNLLQPTEHPLFSGLPAESYLYYVHSYYAELHAGTIGTTEYGIPYSAALHKDNFYALQAHPEKSGKTGEKILENFLKLEVRN